MAVDLMSQTGIALPQVSGNMIMNFALYTAGFVMAVGILGFITWMYIKYKKYNQHLKIFGKINGAIVPIYNDRGMFQRVGIAGDFWCRTMRHKKVIPRPTISMGKNVYWYFIREDGEWINFGIQDIDKVMKEAKVYYVDEDMRLQRLGIERNLRQRYEKKEGFWAKYGGLLINIFFVLIVMVALILLFKEMGGLAEKLESVAGSVGRLAESVNNMLTRGGSGVIPV